MKRQQKNKTEFDFANKIAILEANEATNVARIGRTQQEKDALSVFTEDGEGHSLEENLRIRMEENTQKLYVTAKDIEVKTNDPEYTKLISQETLPMLNEIEVMLNHYLETFQSFENEDRDEYIAVQKNITAELRRKNRIENFEREKKINEEKKAQRD